MNIGIIARDTDIVTYCQVLTLLGYEPVIINKTYELDSIKGLIISGDQNYLEQSLLNRQETLAKIRQRAMSGMAVLGIASGVSLLAGQNPHKSYKTLDIMDITVDADPCSSTAFNAELSISALGPEPVQARFLQAPLILACQPNVGILAMFQEKIVLARQGDFLACTFYPILTDDFRVLKYFTTMVEDAIL